MDEPGLDDEELAAIEEDGGGGGDVPEGFVVPVRVERSARSVVIRGESRPLIGSFCSAPFFGDLSSPSCRGGALGWEEGVKKLRWVSMGGRDG